MMPPQRRPPDRREGARSTRQGPPSPPGRRPGSPPRPPGGQEAGGYESPGRYPLPRGTAEAVLGSRAAGTNLSLALNKLVGPWSEAWEPPKADERKEFLQACAGILAANRPAAGFLGEFRRRRQAMLESFRRPPWHLEQFEATVEWRFVSGLGSANPLEVNLVLHRIGGFPIIPGSGIKGATLAYARSAPGVDERDWQPVFGREEDRRPLRGQRRPGHRGGVIFFDAVPAAPPKLVLDVMTPHYGEYYQGKSPPADYLSPTPLTFLAVEGGTRFHFAVASKDAALAAQAAAWLRQAVEAQGLGGKTAAGYGFFTIASRASS